KQLRASALLYLAPGDELSKPRSNHRDGSPSLPPALRRYARDALLARPESLLPDVPIAGGLRLYPDVFPDRNVVRPRAPNEPRRIENLARHPSIKHHVYILLLQYQAQCLVNCRLPGRLIKRRAHGVQRIIEILIRDSKIVG